MTEINHHNDDVIVQLQVISHLAIPATPQRYPPASRKLKSLQVGGNEVYDHG